MALAPTAAHTGRAAHNVGLLNRRVEYARIAVFLGQQGRFAKNAPQLTAHVLPVEQRLRELTQNIIDGVQGGIYHQHFVGAGGAALARLPRLRAGGANSWSEKVAGSGLGAARACS